jgi:anti-sigma regulatory factor (Ser/Thr protein kinase)
MMPIAEERFAKSFDSLPAVFAFLEGAFARITSNPEYQQTFALAVEEFFTNMVKYHPEGQNPIVLSVFLRGTELRVVLADTGVEPYDVTQAPEPDLDAPLGDRRVGGLGIYLSKALLDDIGYDHRDGTSYVTLKKYLEPNDVFNQQERQG